MNELPKELYGAESSRELDHVAITKFDIPGYELMKTAGKAVFDFIQDEYPLFKKILICCGAGNNAGDGYVVAKLATKAGLDVDVVSLIDPKKLSGDAKLAYEAWKSLGHQLTPLEQSLFVENQLIVDALLGTGLQRSVEGDWLRLIEMINAASLPVVAVDIPSGLSADTGTVKGVAVEADHTVSFIGLKKGMFTHQAGDYCGGIVFNNLGVPDGVYEKISAEACLIDDKTIKNILSPRKKSSHKGNNGHVLVVGGDYGMAGATRLAAESALRAGAGLVTVVTRSEHVSALVSGCPELMVLGCDNGVIPHDLISKATCVIVGPGLGQREWGNKLLGQVLETTLPKIIDADALNLFSPQDAPRDDWILTPHPGEAARLLETSTKDLQQNRYASVSLLQENLGGVVVLKGFGTLIKSNNGVPLVCPYGNPGMATAGMGDVLTGIIAAFVAQGMDVALAAEMGVLIHAKAGDIAAEKGERGLIASDLFAPIRGLINPGNH